MFYCTVISVDSLLLNARPGISEVTLVVVKPLPSLAQWLESQKLVRILMDEVNLLCRRKRLFIFLEARVLRSSNWYVILPSIKTVDIEAVPWELEKIIVIPVHRTRLGHASQPFCINKLTNNAALLTVTRNHEYPNIRPQSSILSRCVD